MENILPFFF